MTARTGYLRLRERSKATRIKLEPHNCDAEDMKMQKHDVKGLTHSSSSSDSSEGRATSSSSSSASCFLLRVDIVCYGVEDWVDKRCCGETKLGRRASCKSQALGRGPDGLRTFRRMAGKPGKGTSLYAKNGICVQPIVRGAHGTRRLSSEPEEGFELSAADCLRPWVCTCMYHLKGSSSLPSRRPAISVCLRDIATMTTTDS